jgi:hypothetical protein
MQRLKSCFYISCEGHYIFVLLFIILFVRMFCFGWGYIMDGPQISTTVDNLSNVSSVICYMVHTIIVLNLTTLIILDDQAKLWSFSVFVILHPPVTSPPLVPNTSQYPFLKHSVILYSNCFTSYLNKFYWNLNNKWRLMSLIPLNSHLKIEMTSVRF